MWTSTGISSTIFWPVLTQTISLFKVINIGRLADAENKKVVLVSWLNSTLLYRHFFLSVCSKRLIILLIILSVGCLVSKMSENGDKCQSVFPKTQDCILKCLVLSTTQRNSEERNQKIFTNYTFNLWSYCLINGLSKSLMTNLTKLTVVMIKT